MEVHMGPDVAPQICPGEAAVFQAELRQLAAALGVQDHLEDGLGDSRDIAPEDIQSLLQGLGYPAGTPAALQASLTRLYAERAAAKLEPTVIRTDAELGAGALKVRLLLESDDAWRTRPLRARLESAAGTAEEISLIPESLEEVGQKQCGGRTWIEYDLTLKLGAKPAWGYYTLIVSGADEQGADAERRAMFAATPDRWYIASAIQSARKRWGLQVQINELSSTAPGYWGMGDWRCAYPAIDAVADRGGDVLGISPAHAMQSDPREVSLYSPDSRIARNTRLIRAEDVPEYAKSTAAQLLVNSAWFQERVAGIRGDFFINPIRYDELQQLVLPMLYAEFVQSEAAVSSPRAQAFAAACREGGWAGRMYALFRAIQEEQQSMDPQRQSWLNWPERYRNMDEAALRDFEATRPHAVGYHQYLQFLALEQETAAADYARERGLVLGLYPDLALGAVLGGADSWMYQKLLALRLHVGVPPGPGAEKGQDWGSPPFIPEALRRAHYAPWLAAIRENTRNAGMLRLDHSFHLAQLYMIAGEEDAAGALQFDARRGAYVHYRADDMMKLLALESHNQKCTIVCEDLGVAPKGFTQLLADYGALGYDVFRLMPDVPRERYRALSVGTTSNHDWMSLAATWIGFDIDLDEVHGAFPDKAARQRALADRAEYRRQVGRTLQQAGLGLEFDAESPVLPAGYGEASIRFVAGTAAAVVMLPLHDVRDTILPTNRPGFGAYFDQSRPYSWLWGVRSSLPVEELGRLARLDLAAAIMATHGRGRRPD